MLGECAMTACERKNKVSIWRAAPLQASLMKMPYVWTAKGRSVTAQVCCDCVWNLHKRSVYSGSRTHTLVHDCLGLNPSTVLYYYYFLINLFIYLWLCWVFVATHGLSLVVESGGYFSLQCTGFSLRWLLLLWSMGSKHVGFSSCGRRAQ